LLLVLCVEFSQFFTIFWRFGVLQIQFVEVVRRHSLAVVLILNLNLNWIICFNWRPN